ncbi:MAG: hypothetical protein ACYC1E_06465 [Propionibacteriaceae bacterium]
MVYDGVLWPPYAALFAAECGAAFHYALLLPPLEVTLARVRARSGHRRRRRDRHVAFVRDHPGISARHRGARAIGEVAHEIARLVEAGTIRTGG